MLGPHNYFSLVSKISIKGIDYRPGKYFLMTISNSTLVLMTIFHEKRQKVLNIFKKGQAKISAWTGLKVVLYNESNKTKEIGSSKQT